MSTGSDTAWVWDENRQDYYYVTSDTFGNYTYHYSKEQAPATPQQSQQSYTQPGVDQYDPATAYSSHDRADSLNTPEPVPDHVKLQPSFIGGTPDKGSTEGLDPSYRIRPGAEAYSFFKVGKVFSMLHVQAASAEKLFPISDNITVIKYGERAFSQIRRFVIVDVRRGFVYACPIFTYTKQGTLKKGCVPSEHSVIYLTGTTPVMFTGEYERGLVKQPIRVNPAVAGLQMDTASRLHYGKAYPIEMNVKVKDIGNVDRGSLSLLLQYYREENGYPTQPIQDQFAQGQQTPTHSSYQTYPSQTQSQYLQAQPRTYTQPHPQYSQPQSQYSQGHQAEPYPAQPYPAQTYPSQNYPMNYY